MTKCFEVTKETPVALGMCYAGHGVKVIPIVWDDEDNSVTLSDAIHHCIRCGAPITIQSWLPAAQALSHEEYEARLASDREINRALKIVPKEPHEGRKLAEALEAERLEETLM